MDKKYDIISFDLETTGLSKTDDRMVELGATIYTLHISHKPISLHLSHFHDEVRRVILEYADPICVWTHAGDFVESCKSDVKMSAESTRITGITQESIDAQPFTAKDVLRHFKAFVDRSCTNTRILAGWNVLGFDLPVTCLEAMGLPENALKYFMSIGVSLFDAMLLAKKTLPPNLLLRNKMGQTSYKLGDVYRALLKKPLLGAHGGLADASAVIEILQTATDLFLSCLIKLDKPNEPGACELGVMPLMSTVVGIVQDFSRKRTSGPKSSLRAALNLTKLKRQKQNDIHS